MYYKIENKECEVYKQLHEMRTSELRMEKENKLAVEEKTGLKFETFLGHSGQQNFRRVTQYDGFIFLEPEKVCLKTWKKHPKQESVYVPNTRTQLGKAMSMFISNGLQGSHYQAVFKILKCKLLTRFVMPYVEISNEIILIFLGEDYELKDENIIEITKKEFYAIIDQSKS